MAEERRQTRRLPVRRSMLRCPTLEVRALDISAGGLAVEAPRALRIGGHYRFTLRLDGEEASFAGRVLWCRLQRVERTGGGETRPVYRAGVVRLEG